MADVQARVQALLDELIERGAERGLQVAAYHDGALVVDAWAGVADPADGRPVDGDTLFNVFSVTKGVTATAIHLLTERGLLDYDAPVARHWPEFAANGKAGITLRHVLTHAAGVPQLPDGTGPAEMCDWAGTCRGVAALTPQWEPGTATGYGSTWGFILGEVARRADGRPLDVIVRDDLCAPLGIADLHLRLPDAAAPRVAALEGDPARPAAPQPTTEQVYNRPDVRRALIPGGGAIASARALAHLYAALVGAAPGGIQLLPPERVRIATALQTEEVDRTMGLPVRKALGYFLGGPGTPMVEWTPAFGNPGYGGTVGFADQTHRFAFALTKNRMIAFPDLTAANRAAAVVRAALGIPEAA